MNAKQKTSILLLAGSALAVSYWTGYFHGSSIVSRREMFISIALPLIFIWTMAKLIFAVAFRGNNITRLGGGPPPPSAPSPGVPVPRPPGAPPLLECEHRA